MPRPFAVIGFTAFFTIALLFNFDIRVTEIALAMFFAALVISVLIPKTRNGRVIPCSLASAVVSCILFLTSFKFYYMPSVSYEGKNCNISATLISEPEYEYGNCYYTGKVESIDSESVDLKVKLVFSTSIDAEPFDKIKGDFMFYIPGKSNDISLSSNISNGVFLGAYPFDESFEVVNIPESEKPFVKKIFDLRADIKNAVYRILPNESGALAVALLIGDKSGLSPQTLDNFRFIGLSHIICVSGYHLSLWSMLAYEILRKTKLGIRFSSLLCIFPVVVFMLVSGMTYSVIRAGIMVLIYLLSNVFLRKNDSLNSLGFALVIFAVFNPYAIGSASLQLSALATAGILIYSENYGVKVDDYFNKIPVDFLRKSTKLVFSVLMITVAANAFTLPVSLSLYNSFNFLVFISNMVAVPVSGICMILCAIGSAIGCISTSIINIPAYFGGLLTRFLLFFSDKLSDFKALSFTIEQDKTSVIIISLFAICVFSLLLAFYGKTYPKLTFLLCSTVFVVLTVSFSLADKNLTKVHVVDCGNGLSVVLSKGDETVLIGCSGTEFLGSFNLCIALDETGNETESVIFPDTDAVSSDYFIDILNEFNPFNIYCNEYPDSSAPLMKNREIHSFDESISNNGFDIECHTVNNKSFAYVRNEDAVLLILFDIFTDINQIPEEFRYADVIITRNDYPCGIENMCLDLVVVNSENNRGLILQNELSEMNINCAVTSGCGDILIKADDGYISAYRS